MIPIGPSNVETFRHAVEKTASHIVTDISVVAYSNDSGLHFISFKQWTYRIIIISYNGQPDKNQSWPRLETLPARLKIIHESVIRTNGRRELDYGVKTRYRMV